MRGKLTFDKTGKLLSQKTLSIMKANLRELQSLWTSILAPLRSLPTFLSFICGTRWFYFRTTRWLGNRCVWNVRANYTNGQNNPLGKIVLANFNNQNGLKQIGNATYVATAVSGDAQVGEAGAEGFGTVLSGSLERSNVDITEELVNLITAQRNFQASAKAIETTTTLTQTIINIRG